MPDHNEGRPAGNGPAWELFDNDRIPPYLAVGLVLDVSERPIAVGVAVPGWRPWQLSPSDARDVAAWLLENAVCVEQAGAPA